MNVSRLRGCRCAFGPAETFDIVQLFCSFPVGRVLLVCIQLCPSLVGHVYLFSPLPLNFFSRHAADIFFLFFFRLFVASGVIFFCPHGSRRSFVLLFFSFYLFSVLLLTKLTSSFTLLFPIFLVYLFCLPENLLGLSACQSKGEAGSPTQSHKFSHTFWFVPPSTWRPFLSPVSTVPCSRSIALLLIDPDV